MRHLLPLRSKSYNLKEFFKNTGLYSLVFLLYLSNTGLVLTVHTCIHTGISVVELPSFQTHDDVCSEVIGERSCAQDDNADDCCSREIEKKEDCHTHKTEYKKADYTSIKPEPNKYGTFTGVAEVSFIYYQILPLIPKEREEHHIIYHANKARDNTTESALEYRIGLASFLC